MYFCSFCENMLIIEKHSNNLIFSCKSCPYIQEITNTLYKTYKFTTKGSELMLGGAEEFKYASMCDKKCIKCENTKAMFIEIQTRSADEPMTIFYYCIACRETWKE